MIKVIWAAHRIPGMTDSDFYRHWGEIHGGLGTKVPGFRRYIQHHTLAAARDGGDPAPTHDGASIGWFDDVAGMQKAYATPEWQAMVADAPNLFDRVRPMSVVVAHERVVKDGPTTPGMVKAIWVAARAPGLSDEEFFGHWYEVHGKLGAKAPGVRRYVQNHAIAEAAAVQGGGGMTHDGWTEMWFDDLDAMRQVMKSPEWQTLRQDRPIFAPPMTVVVAQERPIIP